jgi:hypothetical protein
MNRKDLDPRCFHYTTLLGVIFMEQYFHECYANDLRTITCSGVLGHYSNVDYWGERGATSLAL